VRGQKVAKLSSRLASVAAVARQSGSDEALQSARAQALRTQREKVWVVVLATPGHVAAASAAVGAAGGDVSERRGLAVLALVPPAALETVAKSDAVTTVRAPFRPKALAVDQGVTTTGADWAKSIGYNGSGQSIAIIDLGFSGYSQAISSGALPAGLTTVNYCTHGGSFSAGTAHGTAVAEITYQMAPGAHLYLICIDNEVALSNAESYVKANGIKIVNHSVGWFNTGRGDGTSAEPPGVPTPDSVVADARANGILWVNAAGNEAQVHWGGGWLDSVPSNGWLNFNGGSEGDQFVVAGGGQACVFLKWDNWPKGAGGYTYSNIDYDLFVYPGSASLPADPYSGPTPVAWSVNEQSGGADQTPTEETCFTNPGLNASYKVAVFNYDAPFAQTLDLFVEGDTSSISDHAEARSITEPASSPNAMAVGAVCWQSTAVEFYSSQGPTIDNRTKPDISGPDRTSSDVYGSTSSCSGGFAGTSAASPHVAGAAALVLQQKPGHSVSQLQDALEQSSTVLLLPGNKTNSVGWGGLRVPARPTTTLSFGTPDRTSVPTTDGVIDNHGRSTTFTLQYGLTTSYGQTSVALSGSGGDRLATGGSFIGTLTGLTPNTTYHARVVATNDYGTTNGPDKTFATAPDHVVNVSSPTISGFPQVGKQLSVYAGNWSGYSADYLQFNMHFDRCNAAATSCVEVGSTGPTSSNTGNYTLVAGDAGSYIRVRVTIVDPYADNLPQVATSTVTAQVVSAGTPYLLSRPALFGAGPDENSRAVGYDGVPFSATGGDWSVTAGSVTTAYQWQRCVPGADDVGGVPAEPSSCVDIAGATSSTYSPVIADWLHTVRVKVTATGQDGSRTSYSRQGYVRPAQAPSNDAAPTISPTAPHVGQLLTASAGTWSTAPSVSLSYVYTWRRCAPLTSSADFDECPVEASGATNSHTVTGSDLGYRIVLQVTAKNLSGLGRMNNAWSSPTEVVTS
jgi:hypothetical protein